MSDELCKQVRTAFRVISLRKPDLGSLFRHLLFMENFTMPDETSQLLENYFTMFNKIKFEMLYKDRKGAAEEQGEEISLTNLRTALKLAFLLKN